jgi:N-acetylglucosamine-6-phosphate deacetylase
MIIRHGTVFTPHGFEPNYSTRIDGERIAEIGRDDAVTAADGEPSLDAQGSFVVPGFVDVHVHGAAGYDTMDASAEALAGMAAFFARHGVTSFLATTITAPRAATLAAIRAVASYSEAPPNGARLIGLHLEGPYLNRAAKGAQPEQFCRAPDVAEMDEFAAAGPVRLISLAPELPGAEACVRAAVSRGIHVAVGHTQATYEQVEEAAAWGVDHAAHTFNAMTGLHHRQPGAAGAILTDDRLVAEIIADGIHLHPAVIALAVRAKTPARVALITDAMRATGLPEGTYDLGGQDVIVRDGSCWLIDASGGASRTLAGSTLTLDAALRNAMLATGLSLAEALPMATTTPAASIGMAGRIGTLASGYLADIALLDPAGRVQLTVVGGQVVYDSFVSGNR